VVETLESAFAKLDGASERMNKVTRTIAEGAVTDLLKTRTNRDRQGRVRIRVKEIGEIPEEWHVWIGECIHDMRSAVDHLAYALNIAGSGLDPPPNFGRSAFPLTTKRCDFRSLCTESRKRPEKCAIGHFPRGARTIAERLQPYHRRTNLHARQLAILAELSNIDKHRRFPLTALLTAMIEIPEWVEGHPVTGYRNYLFRPFKPNATIMRLDVPALARNIKEPKVDFEHICALNFKGKASKPSVPLLVEHLPVPMVLEGIIETIRSVVFPQFEPLLR